MKTLDRDDRLGVYCEAATDCTWTSAIACAHVQPNPVTPLAAFMGRNRRTTARLNWEGGHCMDACSIHFPGDPVEAVPHEHAVAVQGRPT